MVHVRLLWLLGLTSVLLAGTEARCSSDYDIECLKGSHCISLTSVCDSSKHCSDGSDEDPYVCESWTRSSSQCGSGRIHCSSPTTPRYRGYSSFGTSYDDTTKDCVRIAEACSRSSCSPSLSSRMCEA
ncbi:low-density lipoprotein receptor [Procambarus clarkii]|uniref:low-density lipoprotein receptor n=1 Tax=Procambarus clarkii TaxID=6728 RepID=UPI003742505E